MDLKIISDLFLAVFSVAGLKVASLAVGLVLSIVWLYRQSENRKEDENYWKTKCDEQDKINEENRKAQDKINEDLRAEWTQSLNDIKALLTGLANAFPEHAKNCTNVNTNLQKTVADSAHDISTIKEELKELRVIHEMLLNISIKLDYMGKGE